MGSYHVFTNAIVIPFRVSIFVEENKIWCTNYDPNKILLDPYLAPLFLKEIVSLSESICVACVHLLIVMHNISHQN